MEGGLDGSKVACSGGVVSFLVRAPRVDYLEAVYVLKSRWLKCKGPEG